MSLFAELRRRNVFRIGVAYLVVAWLLMQVAALAAPALLLPEWVTTFVVFLLLLGFPVALLLAWAYEVTPEGVKKTKDLPAHDRGIGLANRKLDFVVIGLLAIALVVLLFDRYGNVLFEADTAPMSEATETGMDSSIAVLPFINMSDDPNQEHFADGLTEELLNSLAGIEELRVISRTSSFSFKDQSLPLDDIVSELGVSHILEGSVRRAGNRIRVTAQLIEAASDTHLWSETYDRELTVDNILDIQEDVAKTVVRALHATLRPEENALLRVKGPATLEALDLYHDGMYFLRQIEISQNVDDARARFESAVDKFESSIKLDAEWAPPHAALGRVYHFWKDVGNREEKLRISRRHVMRSIELDSEYGPAYASLGYIDTIEGDYEGAFEAYERANDLGAEDSWGMALLLRTLGRFDDAVVEYRKAASRDPLSIGIKEQLASSLDCAGRYKELISMSDWLLAVLPDSREISSWLAKAYVHTGDVSRGMQLADAVVLATGTEASIANILALSGQTDRAHAAIMSEENGNWWFARVPAAVTLGERDLAINILEQVEGETPRALRGMRCVPEIRSLAGNPRYDALLERLDLPE